MGGKTNTWTVNFDEVEEVDMISKRVKKEIRSKKDSNVENIEGNTKWNENNKKKISKSNINIRNNETNSNNVDNIKKHLRNDTNKVEPVKKDVITKEKIKIKRKMERVNTIKRNRQKERNIENIRNNKLNEDTDEDDVPNEPNN